MYIEPCHYSRKLLRVDQHTGLIIRAVYVCKNPEIVFKGDCRCDNDWPHVQCMDYVITDRYLEQEKIKLRQQYWERREQDSATK